MRSTIRASVLVEEGWRDRVGISVDNGRLRVALPKAYDSLLPTLQRDSKRLLRETALLVRVLAQYRRQSSPRSFSPAGARPKDSTNVFEGATSLLTQLDAALQLRDDYLSNGFFYRRKLQPQRAGANGVVDWRNTTRRYPPLLQADNILFLNFQRRRRLADRSDLLFRFHASVMREIGELFGSLGSISDDVVLSAEQMEEVRRRPALFLERFSGEVYSDRGISILRLLRAYLECNTPLGGPIAQEALFCSTSAFELIWEEMLRRLLWRAPSSVSRSVKYGEWTSATGKAEQGIAPRLDIVRFGATTSSGALTYLLLLDAKDKRIRLGGRTGSEGDHYKQAMYAKLLNNFPIGRLRNVLVFPEVRDGERSRSLLFSLNGRHRWKGIDDTTVFEAYADYSRVARWYVGQESLAIEEEVTQLVSRIEALDQET